MLTPIAIAVWAEMTLQVVLLAFALAAARALMALVLASRGLSTPRYADAMAATQEPVEPVHPATAVAQLAATSPASTQTMPPPSKPTPAARRRSLRHDRPCRRRAGRRRPCARSGGGAATSDRRSTRWSASEPTPSG